MNVNAVDTRRAAKEAYFNERAEYKSMTEINKLCAQCLKA